MKDEQNINDPLEQREERIDAEIKRDLAEIAKDTREIERLEAEKEQLEHHHKHPRPDLVKITVDGKQHDIRPGEYVVAQLKTEVGVPANYELEELRDGTMVPLDDNATIRICGGESFISHVRRGGSSHAE